jgi:hypothetical protein
MECNSLEPGLSCNPSNCAADCGLANVCALLDNPDIEAFEGAVDHLLDLRSMLNGGDAREGIAAFIELRRLVEHRFVIEMFRLKRWMENHFTVVLSQAGTADCNAVLPFEGKARSIEHLETYYRNRFFEFHPEVEAGVKICLDYRQLEGAGASARA